jgi:hypothetical protein
MKWCRCAVQHIEKSESEVHIIHAVMDIVMVATEWIYINSRMRHDGARYRRKPPYQPRHQWRANDKRAGKEWK